MLALSAVLAVLDTSSSAWESLDAQAITAVEGYIEFLEISLPGTDAWWNYGFS